MKIAITVAGAAIWLTCSTAHAIIRIDTVESYLPRKTPFVAPVAAPPMIMAPPVVTAPPVITAPPVMPAPPVMAPAPAPVPVPFVAPPIVSPIIPQPQPIFSRPVPPVMPPPAPVIVNGYSSNAPAVSPTIATRPVVLTSRPTVTTVAYRPWVYYYPPAPMIAPVYAPPVYAAPVVAAPVFAPPVAVAPLAPVVVASPVIPAPVYVAPAPVIRARTIVRPWGTRTVIRTW